jgi:hypothetical protein
MRQLFAFILLIPCAILFAGWMSLSAVCPVTPQDTCTASQHPCCSKGKCTSNREPRKDHKADGPSCCFDCPLCALVTIKPFIRFEWVRTVSFVDYAVIPKDNLKDYFQEHWKPPDFARLS